MARTRLIKPALFENEILGQMDGDTVLLFTGLWCVADRDGRLEDRPLRIKAQLFPYRDADVSESLKKLDDAGFIIRYEAEGIKCIQVNNWAKHQRPHIKENPSDLPPPNRVSTNLALPRQCSAVPRLLQERPSPLTLNPSPNTLTLNPSSGVGSVEVEEEKSRVSNEAVTNRDIQPHQATLAAEASEFETFWAAYPEHRRTKLVTVQREWIAMSHQRPTLDKILAALANHRASEDWNREGGKFVPSALNWISEQAWHEKKAPAKKSSAPSGPLKPKVILTADPIEAEAWISENYPAKAGTPFSQWPPNVQRLFIDSTKEPQTQTQAA